MMDLGEVIRQKERELLEVVEMRHSSLESNLLEKDQLLKEAAVRFQQVRDDFEYNLSLLETRDKEVARLDCLLQQSAVEKEKKVAEVKALQHRLERYEAQEKQSKARESQTLSTSKAVLQEMHQEIESVRWAMTEEVKAKLKEILGLKADLRRVQASRESALTSQRQDLSATFENMLAQREESFKQREHAINEQVGALESKFEEARVENLKLKTDISSSQRRIEQLGEEIAQKEEAKRQLTWELEDVRCAKTTDLDAHRRREKELEREIDALRDTLVAREKKERDVGLEMSQLRSALRDEAERRQTAEKGLTQAQRDVSGERTETMRLVQEHVEREEALIEKIHKMQELGEAQAKMLEQVQEGAQLKEEESASLRGDLYKTQAALRDATESLQQAAYEGDQERVELGGTISALQEEVESLRGEVTAARSLCEDARKATATAEMELDDARAETDVLRLRLKLHENVVRLTVAGVQGGAGMDGPALRSEESPTANPSRSQDSAASPLFSEDMGPVSLPASPQHMLSPPLTRLAEATPDTSAEVGAAIATAATGGGMDLSASEGNESAFPLLAANVAANTDAAAALAQENEWLKNVVKGMRKDMEVLQHRLSQSPVPVRERNGGDGVDDRAELLETRLQQATSEIARLRDERRRLMNLGNEMRASLNRQKREILGLKQGGVSPAQAQLPHEQLSTFYVPPSLAASAPLPVPPQHSVRSPMPADPPPDPVPVPEPEPGPGPRPEGRSSSNANNMEIVGTTAPKRGSTTAGRGIRITRGGSLKVAGVDTVAGRADEGARAAAARRVMNYAQARVDEERERKEFDDAQAEQALPL